MSFEDFSLPEMVISRDDYDLEFKFCSVIEPGVSPDSPADHLFSNGQLVPHDFPCSSSKNLSLVSRSTSWGSSKDGSEFSSSSRSNSCSSILRSSSCSSSSSSRTNTSDAISERRVLIRARRPRSGANKRAPEAYKVHKHVSTSEHGSQKWQFIAATPVLNGNVLRKGGKLKKGNRAESADQKVSKNKKDGKSNWKRFFCLCVSACSEFHAIEPSTIQC